MRRSNGNKTVFCALLIAVSIFSGCGEPDNPIFSTEELAEKQGVEGEALQETPAGEPVENKEHSADMPRISVPVSSKAEEVDFSIGDGINPMRAVHRCVSDDKALFLACNEPDVYCMPLGSDVLSPIHIENPEGLIVCHIAQDTAGRMHLLMADESYENWFIWQLDQAYKTVHILDISPYCETKITPLWFLIDTSGKYYLQWAHHRNGMILDEAGKLLHSTDPGMLGIGWIYEAAVGKDGGVYLVYSTAEGQLEIGELDMRNGSLAGGHSIAPFSSDDTLSAMSAGTDTNFLLYSPYSGIWAYDTACGVPENRVPMAELGLNSNQEFLPLTLLADGRLLLGGHVFNEDGSDTDHVTLKYIPAGR